MKKRMNLKIREVCNPNECRQIVNENVSDISLATDATRNRKRLDPRWCEVRRVLFIEEFPEHSFRKSLHCHRSIFEVRKKIRRNADVVIDYVCLSKPMARIHQFIEV